MEGRDVGRRRSARVAVWPREVELCLALDFLSIQLLSEPIFTLIDFLRRLQQPPMLTEEQEVFVALQRGKAKKEGFMDMATVVASKAMKAGAAADAAGTAAAKQARRSAAYAASQALGAKRRGQAAAEKAFTWMRSGRSFKEISLHTSSIDYIDV